MKTLVSSIGLWLLMCIGTMLCWILGFGLSQALFKVSLPETEEDSRKTLILLFLMIALEIGVLLWVHRRLDGNRFQRFLTIFSFLFGIQFVMSQIEAWAFQSAVGMSSKEMLQTVVGGFLFALLVSGQLVFTQKHKNQATTGGSLIQLTIGKVLLLVVVVYPLLYWLAGYFIAWQFQAIRQYYTGDANNEGMVAGFLGFFMDGLYFLQVGRAFLWFLLAWPFLFYFRGSRLQGAFLLGALFSVLHCAQLLLPNPYMPAEIRYPHFLETASSTFIWGFVVAWVLLGKPKTMAL
ncbi:MAG: hypothetical protein SFV55_21760 [Haliscomenobacter sp.]|uniref:hypothetical protein n=1 Tax=Haliscomenobacter sp. TaxID=2717303 RepID=UPI0029B9837C|nr:hypothetical protein [Haliscomenobacter sp.]MDX2071071.1 hypothetical protein [Haliscomenobacter sp.]